jgi:hypothetical protein
MEREVMEGTVTVSIRCPAMKTLPLSVIRFLFSLSLPPPPSKTDLVSPHAGPKT